MRNLLIIFDFSVFKDSKYFWILLEFLISESPNIIQIIGFPILFGVLIRTSPLATLFISFLTALILMIYLTDKFRHNVLNFPNNVLTSYKLGPKNTLSITAKINCYFLIISLLIFPFINWIITLNH